MTRNKAVTVSKLLFKIESLETLHEEILGLDSLQEFNSDFEDNSLEDELLAVVQARLDKALKELEEM
jgi:hypothetical protein